eukprot:4720181-Pleurochrysis_carterae.AAC.6
MRGHTFCWLRVSSHHPETASTLLPSLPARLAFSDTLNHSAGRSPAVEDSTLFLSNKVVAYTPCTRVRNV